MLKPLTTKYLTRPGGLTNKYAGMSAGTPAQAGLGTQTGVEASLAGAMPPTPTAPTPMPKIGGGIPPTQQNIPVAVSGQEQQADMGKTFKELTLEEENKLKEYLKTTYPDETGTQRLERAKRLVAIKTSKQPTAQQPGQPVAPTDTSLPSGIGAKAPIKTPGELRRDKYLEMSGQVEEGLEGIQVKPGEAIVSQAQSILEGSKTMTKGRMGLGNKAALGIANRISAGAKEPISREDANIKTTVAQDLLKLGEGAVNNMFNATAPFIMYGMNTAGTTEGGTEVLETLGNTIETGGEFVSKVPIFKKFEEGLNEEEKVQFHALLGNLALLGLHKTWTKLKTDYKTTQTKVKGEQIARENVLQDQLNTLKQGKDVVETAKPIETAQVLKEGEYEVKDVSPGEVIDMYNKIKENPTAAPEVYKSKGIDKLLEKKNKLVTEGEKISGQIVKGKLKDQPPAFNVFSEIAKDTKKGATNLDIVKDINTKKISTMKEQDAEFRKIPGEFGVKDGEITVEGPDGILKENYIEKAIKDIDKTLRDAGEIEDYSKKILGKDKTLKDVVIKIKDNTASVEDLNDLARYYGTSFRDKIYTKTGEAKNSKQADNYEATRKKLKEIARDQMPDDITKEMDKKYYEYANTERLMQKGAEAVNTLQQNINKMGWVKKYLLPGTLTAVGAATGGVGGAIGGGLLGYMPKIISTIRSKSFKPEGSLNAIESEALINKRLKKIEKINKELEKVDAKLKKKGLKNKSVTEEVKKIIKDIEELQPKVDTTYRQKGGLADKVTPYKPNFKAITPIVTKAEQGLKPKIVKPKELKGLPGPKSLATDKTMTKVEFVNIQKGDMTDLGKVTGVSYPGGIKKLEIDGARKSVGMDQVKVGYRPKSEDFDAMITKEAGLKPKESVDLYKSPDAQVATQYILEELKLKKLPDNIEDMKKIKVMINKNTGDTKRTQLMKELKDKYVKPKVEPKKGLENKSNNVFKETPNLEIGRTTTKKIGDGEYKMYFIGTSNEVFPGEVFKSVREARGYFNAMKLKAKGLTKVEPKKPLKKKNKVLDQKANNGLVAKVEVKNDLVKEAKKYKSAEEFIGGLEKKGEVLYHGTDADFDIFSLNNFGQTDEGFAGVGHYFTDSKKYAKEYGKNIKKVLVELNNPYIYNDDMLLGSINPDKFRKSLGLNNDTSALKVRQAIIDKGHDGVVIVNNGKKIEVVALGNKQIKTESQLTKIREKANKGLKPKKKVLDQKANNGMVAKVEVKDDLVKEAKKYKSAEEFVDSKKTVYHGTPDFRFAEEFNPNKPGYYKEVPELLADNKDFIDIHGKIKGGFENVNMTTKGKAIYFTDNRSVARDYSQKPAFDYQNSIPGILDRKLIINNPLIIDAKGARWRKFETTIDGEKIVGTRELEEFARKKGYDGLIVKNVYDPYNTVGNEVSASARRGMIGTNYAVFNPNQIKTKSQLKNIREQANKGLKKKK